MIRKRNSFVITDIKDYKKPSKVIKVSKGTKEGSEPQITKNVKKPKVEKKTKFSNSPEMCKNGETKPEIKSSNGREETERGDFPPPKPFKTNRFLRKCFENRRENGMILLSPKVEQKIYKLKKSLRKKGLDESEIIDIIRQRRREEEIKYNKEASKNCFKCRQNGHFVADCPYNSRDNDGVDICYKCGSSEHKLHECRQKSEGLPFAKCFICSEVGHLTRDCTHNTRGVYPKGGECKACHSINHLIKDCPQNQNEQELENEVTLPTFEAIDSVDGDIVDNLVTIKTEEKPKNVIKF